MIEVASAGRVRHVTLNRPEKRNALNRFCCRALVKAFEDADEDAGVGAILLTASGSAFCAGMDLEDAMASDRAELGQLHELVFTQIDRLHKPLVAGVQGAALGGGVGLIANAHIVVASPTARFGLTEIKLGLWPVLVMRAVIMAVGERRATELSLTGRTFDADEALNYGLISEIAVQPLERALAIADALSVQSSEVMAEGLGYTRGLRNKTWEQSAEVSREVRERLMFSSAFTTRAVDFLGRRDLRDK